MSGLKSCGNDQDTFGSLFTPYTTGTTAHSGPHNAKQGIYNLYISCIVQLSIKLVCWRQSLLFSYCRTQQLYINPFSMKICVSFNGSLCKGLILLFKARKNILPHFAKLLVLNGSGSHGAVFSLLLYCYQHWNLRELFTNQQRTNGN